MMRFLKDEKIFFDETAAAISTNGKMIYVGRLLERAAQAFPLLDALIYEDRHITYQELHRQATAVARFLKQEGLKPRERVIICFENSPEFFIAYYAVLQAGAVVAPVNTFLKERELGHIINDAQPRFIITSPDRVERFAKAEGATPPPIITSDHFPHPGDDYVGDEPIDLEPHEMAALLYTSGTTGLPKGVMLSSTNIMTNVLQGVARLQIGNKERLLGVLPLFHVFAQNVCVWSSFFVGATVILVPKIERRQILAALKHKPTGFFGVPALYGLLCLLRNAPIETVKYFITGGDAMPDKIRSYFELLYRRKICNGYGLTETSPLIAVDFDDIAEPTNTIGKLAIGVECQIRDEQGREVAPGAIGELWVKGDNIMMGYYNETEQTAKVLQNGWFNTGDMVYMTPDKKLVISGRTKELIVNKGIKIYPQEVENIIATYPNVIRAAVIAQEDEASGEVPIAYVQLREKEEGIEKKLKELCNQQLASYKVPRAFYCTTDELPLTATAKVDKKALRKK